MKNDKQKEQHEKAVAERFIETYNRENGYRFVIKLKRERPDFDCEDRQRNKTIGLEVTTAYPDSNDKEDKNKIAKVEWDIARGIIKPFNITSFNAKKSHVAFIDSDIELAEFISRLISDKCGENYEFCHPIILLVHVLNSTIVDEADFCVNILPEVKLAKVIPYCEIYLGLNLEQYKIYKLFSSVC